jgi:hypothetical protein
MTLRSKRVRNRRRWRYHVTTADLAVAPATLLCATIVFTNKTVATCTSTIPLYVGKKYFNLVGLGCPRERDGEPSRGATCTAAKFTLLGFRCRMHHFVPSISSPEA